MQNPASPLRYKIHKHLTLARYLKATPREDMKDSRQETEIKEYLNSVSNLCTAFSGREELETTLGRTTEQQFRNHFDCEAKEALVLVDTHYESLHNYLGEQRWGTMINDMIESLAEPVDPID